MACAEFQFAAALGTASESANGVAVDAAMVGDAAEGQSHRAAGQGDVFDRDLATRKFGVADDSLKFLLELQRSMPKTAIGAANATLPSPVHIRRDGPAIDDAADLGQTDGAVGRPLAHGELMRDDARAGAQLGE